ncbi:GNAT family N-acetyltransferase [Streptomyces sp. NPDC005648]|uniref:GNAT family N-acetyltransferase n=1 Tax=Streptomyces sp. NPDC005648 TaxID=3157044 RepID=UPI0033A06781
MRETVTYLEMTAPDQLDPAAPVPGLVLEPLARDSPLVVDIQARIGAPHGWKSATRSAEEWRVWFAGAPDRLYRLLSFEGEPAGLVSYDLHPVDEETEREAGQQVEVEIETFGLVPEFVGKGLGGFALTLGIRQAWALAPVVTRVWLHTSTWDHPRALPNYHRRGLRTFRTTEGERES